MMIINDGDRLYLVQHNEFYGKSNHQAQRNKVKTLD